MRFLFNYPHFGRKRRKFGFVKQKPNSRYVTLPSTKLNTIMFCLYLTKTRLPGLRTSCRTHPRKKNTWKSNEDSSTHSLLTQSKRANLLLDISGLGDKNPSELMDSMLGLLGTEKPCFLFREILLRQMPVDVRAHLIHAQINDLKEMARLADKLYIPHRLSAQAVVKKFPTQRKQISNETETPKPEDFHGKCFYHHTYGSNARQCRPPCNYSPSGNEKAGRH